MAPSLVLEDIYYLFKSASDDGPTGTQIILQMSVIVGARAGLYGPWV